MDLIDGMVVGGYLPKRLGYVNGGRSGYVCGVVDCDKPHAASGVCAMHYARAKEMPDGRRYLAEEFYIHLADLCGFDDCTREARSGFLCNDHARQQKRFGYTWALGTCRECGELGDGGRWIDPCRKCQTHPGRRHGMSRLAYESMVREQDGRCRGCGNAFQGDRWNIDHDHTCCPGSTSCGECVRGLICSACNWALGHAGDSVDTLLNLAMYLEAWNQRKTQPA
jgi:hypothetical protein